MPSGITAGQSPYSKSHARRVRRAQKASNNLVASMADVRQELSLVEAADREPSRTATRNEEEKDDPAQGEYDEKQPRDGHQARTNTGGKGQPKLTAKKRSKVLWVQNHRSCHTPR